VLRLSKKNEPEYRTCVNDSDGYCLLKAKKEIVKGEIKYVSHDKCDQARKKTCSKRRKIDVSVPKKATR
jgi:hypothetical protein